MASRSVTKRGLSRILFGPSALFGPVIWRCFGLSERFSAFEAWRHRRCGPCHHLVVLDVQQPQPALLSHRKRDKAAELDQLGFAVMPVQAIPKRIVGLEPP